MQFPQLLQGVSSIGGDPWGLQNSHGIGVCTQLDFSLSLLDGIYVTRVFGVFYFGKLISKQGGKITSTKLSDPIRYSHGGGSLTF